MPGRDRPEHLQREHGYVEAANMLLPRSQALTWLWDRTFRGDDKAHERLHTLLQEEGGGPAYTAALETELSRRADALFAARWQEVPRVVQNLRRYAPAQAHFRGLLRSKERRVREIGQELLLPNACAELAREGTTTEQVRRWVDRLCPLDSVDEKARFAGRMPQFGALQPAIVAYVTELQQERPVACSECGKAIPRGESDDHLRRVHHIYQFRGERRPLHETVVALVAAVCTAEPDAEAWQLLQGIAQEEHGDRAAAFLAASFDSALHALDAKERAEVVPALAQILSASRFGPKLLTLLAANPDAAARHVALELAARLPSGPDAAARTALTPLLLDTRLPESALLSTAVVLLKSVGAASAEARAIAGAFVAGLSKVKAIPRLERLLVLSGPAPAVEELRSRLQDQMRMRCPRCPAEMRRREMVGHLWNEHRLILDGLRVREPWPLIDEWIEAYRERKDEEILTRCRTLAQQLDPESGVQRVHRLIASRGIESEEVKAALQEEARQQKRSLCPACFALAAIPYEVPPHGLSIRHGRLTGHSYRVEIDQSGFHPLIVAETPHGVSLRLPEPERQYTLRRATFVFVGPFVLLALVLAVLLPLFDMPPLWPVVALSLVAGGIYVWLRRYWKKRTDDAARLVDYAWHYLAPRLHEPSFSMDDSAFLAGLAESSLRDGDAERRRDPLRQAIALTEKAVAAGAARHLAALHRLALVDAARSGQMAVPLMVKQIGRCFDGRLPFTFADELLDQLDERIWTPERRARLRVLLCDVAFEAGFEVANLVDAGRGAPALGRLLGSAAPADLAWLRLLWSLRAGRPWDRCGPASTVFELAVDPEEGKLLARFPDLLLAQRESLRTAGGRVFPADIFLCGRGVVVQDVLFRERPRTVEILSRKGLAPGGFDLVLGDKRFWFAVDPEPVLQRLERWFRLYAELVPQIPAVHEWQSPSVAEALRARDMVTCPECQRVFVARIGQIGVPLNTAGGSA